MELADWIYSVGFSIVGEGTYVYTDRYVLTFWDVHLTCGTLKMVGTLRSPVCLAIQPWD
jgi:hypothetical protein